MAWLNLLAEIKKDAFAIPIKKPIIKHGNIICGKIFGLFFDAIE